MNIYVYLIIYIWAYIRMYIYIVENNILSASFGVHTHMVYTITTMIISTAQVLCISSLQPIGDPNKFGVQTIKTLGLRSSHGCQCEGLCNLVCGATSDRW